MEKDKRESVRTPKKKKQQEPRERKAPVEDHVFFRDRIFYTISCPQEERREEGEPNPLLGVSWEDHAMMETEYKERIRDPLDIARDSSRGVRERIETGQIGLKTFPSASKKNAHINPFFYNSEIQLKGFDERESTKTEMEDFISGKKSSQRDQEEQGETTGTEVRRRVLTKEKRWLKNMRSWRNNLCQICRKKADLKGKGHSVSTGRVLRTRCGCAYESGNTTPAIRAHVECIEKKEITIIICPACKKEIPVARFV